MGGGFDRVREELSALSRAPMLAAAIVIIALVVICGVLHWSYRAALSNRDSHIAFLERRLDEYRDRLGGATPDEARKRIETLETEVRNLRIRLQPRRLTPAQHQAIIDRSRLPAGAKPGTMIIAHEAGCSDCRSFADALLDAFTAQGNWEVVTSVIESPSERPRTGLGIRVDQPLRPPDEAIRLQSALRSAGLPFDVVSGGSRSPVELLVTERMAP